jgi:hypothetical protein
MLESDTSVAARALIAAHGTEALAVAERAAANVGRLGMIEKLRWRERVAAAVKRLEAAQPEPGGQRIDGRLSRPRAGRAAGPTARPSDRAC